MYAALLPVHSILRWVVLILAVWAIVEAVRGRSGSYTGRAGLFFTISLDIQLLLGLALYFVSPTVSTALADMGTAMKTSALRFWAVEHISVMLLALVAAHVTRIFAKKGADERSRATRSLVGFAVTLLLIVATIPWPFRKAIARPLFPGM